MKDKRSCYHLNRCRKSICQNSSSFHDENSQQVSIERTGVSIIKGIHDKPSVVWLLLEGGIENVFLFYCLCYYLFPSFPSF